MCAVSGNESEGDEVGNGVAVEKGVEVGEGVKVEYEGEVGDGEGRGDSGIIPEKINPTKITAIMTPTTTPIIKPVLLFLTLPPCDVGGGGGGGGKLRDIRLILFFKPVEPRC